MWHTYEMEDEKRQERWGEMELRMRLTWGEDGVIDIWIRIVPHELEAGATKTPTSEIQRPLLAKTGCVNAVSNIESSFWKKCI